MFTRFCAVVAVFTASLPTPPAHAQLIRFGTSVGYEYGSAIPAVEGFEPYAKGRTSLYALEAFVGIPVGWFTIYPSYSYAVPSRRSLVRNLDGDYIPDGYLVSRPASEDNPSVLYGDYYFDLSSEVDLSQETAGTYVMLNLGGGLEVGSGYFQITKNATVYSDVLYDEYYYDATSGNVDEYGYWDTYYDHTVVEHRQAVATAIPLVLQWRTGGRGYSSGTQIAFWKSDWGRSISIKYSMSFNL